MRTAGVILLLPQGGARQQGNLWDIREEESAACSRRLRPLRSDRLRISWELGKLRIYGVPRLSTRDKNVHGRTVAAGIVQTAHSHTHDIGHAGETTKQGRPALGAEAAADRVPGVAPYRVELRRALGDRKRRRRHSQDGGKGRPPA